MNEQVNPAFVDEITNTLNKIKNNIPNLTWEDLKGNYGNPEDFIKEYTDEIKELKAEIERLKAGNLERHDETSYMKIEDNGKENI